MENDDIKNKTEHNEEILRKIRNRMIETWNIIPTSLINSHEIMQMFYNWYIFPMVII